MNLWKITRTDKKTGELVAIQYWNADKGGKSPATAQSDLEHERKQNKHLIFNMERVIS